MTAHLATALVLGLLTTPALAADGEDVDALVAEMERSAEELSLPEAPDVYHLRYKLMQLEQVDVQASLGSLIRTGGDPFNSLFVEVRIGSPAFDNTGFGGWQNGFRSSPLPIEPTTRSIRTVAWRVTDRAYKEAVEQFARKDAQFTPPPDYPGDYTLTGPTVDDLGAREIGDPEALRALARALSGAARQSSDTLTVERGDAFVGHEAGSLLIVDTEGTRLRIPIEETTLRVISHVRAADGMLLTDHRLWTVRQPADLPTEGEMATEVTAMAEHLLDLAEQPTFDDEYVGPVLFEDDAAIDLFRYVLLPQLQGTPAEVPFDSWFGELGGGEDEVRLSRRVLPLGWTVVDDPERDSAHPASFVYDVEGSRTRPVTLVDDGIVRQVLMSRVPRKDTAETNGHARGLGVRPQGRPSLMEVTPGKRASEKKLRKTALRLAASYGHDHVIVVRRLQEPAVRNAGGRSFSMFGYDGPALPAPLEIVRLYADGREEVLRGASFSSVQRFVLRDIVAAGESVDASFMISHRGDAWGFGPTEGLPTWMSAPEVLVGEMELIPTPGDPKSVPLVPPPEVTATP